MRFGLFYFLYFGILGIYLPFFNLYCQSLGFSGLEIGVVSAIHPLARLLFPVLWAVLADYLGKRHDLIRLAWSVSLVSLIMLFFVRSFVGVLIILVLYSFFMVPVLPMWEASTVTWVEEEKQNYGSIRLWGSLGFMIWTMIFGYLLDHGSLRLVLYGMLALGFVNGLVVMISKDGEAIASPSQKRFGDLLKNLDLWIFLACLSLMVFSHGTYYGFFSIHLAKVGYAKSLIALFWTLGVLSETLLMVLVGHYLKRANALWILPLCFLAATLRWTLSAYDAHLGTLVLAQLLHGFTFGVFHVASVTFVHRIFPPSLATSAQSLYSSFSFGLGGMLGLLFNGWLYDRVSIQTLFRYDAAVAFLGLVLAVLLWRRGGILRGGT